MRARTDFGTSVALLVRGIRYASGRSQPKLASDLRTSVEAIKQIERGERKCRLNSELYPRLVAEGVPAALLAETTESDKQRVCQAIAYLRSLKVPDEILGEWTSTLGVPSSPTAPVLYRVDVSRLSGEDDDLCSRHTYYTRQGLIESGGEDLCVATERFSMTLLPPRLQAKAITQSYGKGTLARKVARVYQHRAESLVRNMKAGRVQRICALFLEGPTKSMLGSPEDRRAAGNFLRLLAADGRLVLRLLADRSMSETDRARFSSMVVCAPYVAVASSDQVYSSKLRRERRVEQDTPYAYEQLDLVRAHAATALPVSVDEFLEIAS